MTQDAPSIDELLVTVREFVQEIQAAGERAASLTRQLLAFSRREIIERRVVEVNAIVLDTEKMLRRLLGEDVEVRTRLSQGLPRVHADPGQLVQVLRIQLVQVRGRHLRRRQVKGQRTVAQPDHAREMSQGHVHMVQGGDQRGAARMGRLRE